MKNVNYLKINGFNVDDVMESFGDMDLYDEILMEFYNASSDRFIKLDEYLKNNDFINYSIVVHTIKSECLYLGISELANLCYSHQIKSRENDIEYVNKNYHSLISEYKRVLNVIKVYFDIK